MPAPFYRELVYAEDSADLSGNDVTIAQTLLNRWGRQPLLVVDGDFGHASAAAVKGFQASARGQLEASGILDEPTAAALLDCCLADGYRDSGESAGSQGFLYKVLVPVHQNRSVETTAKLLDANNTELLSFRVRAHGHRDDGSAEDWPDFGDGDFGLNELSSDGNTPTGLATIDLNSPEPADVEEEYGPYPINRVVQGLQGNMGLLLSDIRSGILLHTGEWPGWDASMDMPNSDGCLHAHPDDVDAIWQALVALGVQINDNPYSSKDYPYTPQGLISVELVE
uniref:Peptidoglycan binding-like domain-containing protein n=1 Tax=Rhizochromulina marina TaxID=1034831 RepID=A0A7S2SAX5_9STRA